MHRLVGLLVSFALLAPAAHGQILAPSSVGLWISGARGAPIRTRGGIRHDRGLAALTFRATWPLSTAGPVELAYAAEFIPIIIATANRGYRWESPCRGEGTACDASALQVAHPYSTAGVGLAPVGLQMRARLSRALAVFGGASAGVLYFGRPVPDYEAARFNFIGELGAGLELRLRRKRLVGIGYRFQHISNAGTAPINVGIDTHLLLIGFVIPR